MLRSTFWITCALAGMAGVALAEDGGLPAAAQALGKARVAVTAQPDGLIVCEGEEFQVRSPGWEAKAFGTNYYAATLANTFLSRQAYLGAPEQGEKTVAEIAVEIPAAGKYLALVRYEAAYRFETQFRVQVEQEGKLVLDRLYGARNNLKIWAFSEKLKTELKWPWGAGESTVWEGHDAAVDLQPGRAIIRLIADKQPEPAAKRNVDLVMLTTKANEIAERIEKESYLPLDGMLTQSGDIYLKVTNQSAQPLSISAGGNTGGLGTEHSPYWVHQRRWGKFGPLAVAPGQTTDWVEIGSWIDSLNHGQLQLVAGGENLKYRYEFGVRNAAGAIEPIGMFDGTATNLPLAYFGDTRYRRRVIHQADVLYELLDHLKKHPPHGKAPVRTPIYGYTFDPLPGDAKHAAAVAEFRQLYSVAGARGQEDDRLAGLEGPRGYVDVRGVATDKLAEYCQQLGARAKDIRVVSLGDEIGLPEPPGAAGNPAIFRDWLAARGVTPATLGVPVEQVVYDPSEEARKSKPGVFYWSKRYQYEFGIREIKKRTDILRQHLPNAAIGANFSPHHGGQEHAYLGEVFKWVTCFREDGMTLPWSEDYIFQVPAGSQQMNNISLDFARAANRGKADRESMFYVMPHWPGNTPAMWRRMFFGAVQHGATMINLFEFRPVQVAYTENHCTNPEMYAQVLRSFRELGTFEDIVQDGQVRPGIAGLWFSETGDIWRDNLGSFAAGKRGLYTAIIHQQLPLDFVVEDALDGTLAKYRVLYLTDRHVSQPASQKIAEWVAGGGRLFATAGAGMFDERNQPNKVLRELLGVEQTALEEVGPQIDYIKQDIAFVEPIHTVTRKHGDKTESIPVLCVRSVIQTSGGTEILANFSDNSPAVTKRIVGKGQAIYCGFLPALSYYKPAIPKRPVDRTSAEDSLAHLIPAKFDAAAYDLIGLPAEGVQRPVTCSDPRVETSVIESPQGRAIVLVNWSGKPIDQLKVRINLLDEMRAVRAANPTFASGNRDYRVLSDARDEIVFDLDVADAIILRK